MENQFDPTRLNEWLISIATCEDDEVDCDAIVEAVESLVAANARGDDLRAIMPGLALHLDHCPDCRQWYDTLVALCNQEPSSG